MQATQGRTGRVFVLRLERGDKIPACIEDFARANGIRMGSVLLIGGIGGGQIVVGPRDSAGLPPEPMLIPIDGAHEVIGVGLIAPDKNGVSGMHMHASLGRAGQTKTGCVRPGIETWHVCEVVIYEIVDAIAARLPDENTGFELLRTGHVEVK
jgi:predicted DNA-binding protein with PD1-like motif